MAAVAAAEASAIAIARTETPAEPVLPAATVVAGEFVHEDFPPAAPEQSPPPAPVPAPPSIELEWPSDLVQVESDPHKVKAVQEHAPPEAPAPRQRRERPALPPVSEEPLVQIETQKRDMPSNTAPATPAGEQTATTP